MMTHTLLLPTFVRLTHPTTLTRRFASSRNISSSNTLRYPLSKMDSSTSIPGWLHDLYQHKHLERVILALAKRERSRDSARTQSRRHSSGSRKDRVSGKLSTVLLAAPSQTGEKAHYYSIAVGNMRENQPGTQSQCTLAAYFTEVGVVSS
jgi:hypothetical protein